MGKQIKSLLLLMLLHYIYSYFSFHLLAVQLFISTFEKAMKAQIILLHMFLLLQETS